MAFAIRELQDMTDDQLVELHDRVAPLTQVGTGYYLEELHRRSQVKHTEVMLRYTAVIRSLTWVITAATIIQLAVAIANLIALKCR